MLTEVLQKPKQQPWHDGLGDSQKLRRHRLPSTSIIYTMIAAESFRPHHRRVTTIAGSARLRQKHIEIVIGVVALLKAVPANGHAG